MDNIIEISELDIDNTNQPPSTNFGGGLEYLMNDKIKEGHSKSEGNIDLDDLNILEDELKEISDFKEPENISGSSFDEMPSSVKFFDDTPTPIKETNDTSWDGFNNYNDASMHKPVEPKLNKDELLKEKIKYVRKLEQMEKKGIALSKKYTMESNLQEMKSEYDTINEEYSKQNSVKFQGNMLMAMINGLEYLNNKVDPFDIKLDGWGEQVNENLESYDEIFGELHDKYQSKATMSPELKLLFQLGGSAILVHMTNTMFKSSLPNIDDVFKQHPDILKSFQSATINTMSQNNPGLSGFMNNTMNNNNQQQQQNQNNQNNQQFGPPPAMSTQGPNSVPPPNHRPGNNDGGMQKNNRAEMKGPSDISGILSGLKPKSINIKNTNNNDASTISISDLKKMQHSSDNLPKKSKRRQKSETNNTISLDI